MTAAQIERGIPASTLNRKNEWRVAIFVLALIPVIQSVMTWDLDGRLSDAAYFTRHFSFPAMICQFFIIILSARFGANGIAILKNLSRPVFIAFSIWAIVAIYATFSVDQSQAASVLLLGRYFLHFLSFWALAALISGATDFSSIFWYKILALGGFLYVLCLTLFAFVVPDPANFNWILRMPSATNARQIANNMAFLLIPAVALLLFTNPKQKWAFFICAAAMTAFIAWTGSRTAIVGLGFGGLIALAVLRMMPEIKAMMITGASIATGLLISLLFPAPAPQFGLFRMVQASQDSAQFGSGRSETWSLAIEHIGNNPIWGHGSGRYRENMSDFVEFQLNHPHNFALQFFYDWGLIGGGAAVLLLALLGWHICKSARKTPLAGFAAVTAFFAIIAMSSIEGALFHPIPIILAIAAIIPVFYHQLKFDRTASNKGEA